MTVNTNRVFVSFYGNKSSKGEWTCRKDPRNHNCVHIRTASETELIQRLLHKDFGSEHESKTDNSESDTPEDLSKQ